MRCNNNVDHNNNNNNTFRGATVFCSRSRSGESFRTLYKPMRYYCTVTCLPTRVCHLSLDTYAFQVPSCLECLSCVCPCRCVMDGDNLYVYIYLKLKILLAFILIIVLTQYITYWSIVNTRRL